MREKGGSSTRFGTEGLPDSAVNALELVLCATTGQKCQCQTGCATNKKSSLKCSKSGGIFLALPDFSLCKKAVRLCWIQCPRFRVGII